MASEIPQDTPFDPTLTDTASASTYPSGEQELPSVWQTEWQSVALAWLGGIFVGGIFLILAFGSQSDTKMIAAMVGGGVFLAVFPGLCATLQTWQGYRRSLGKGSVWPWDNAR